MLSNLRECVYLVTRGHFRTKSTVTPFYSIRRFRVIADGSCTLAGIAIFDRFCSHDLDLDPMTFTYKLDPRYTGCGTMNFVRGGFRKLSSDRHTDRDATKIIYHAASLMVNNVSRD